MSTDVVRRRNISGGSTVKLIPGASDTNAKVEKEETYTSTLPHVVAYGEGESIAEWRFDATQAEIIDGVYRLPFVARTSWRVRCRAELVVAATCRERLGGLIPYRAELPPVVATIVMEGK
ncbi:MAG: hypothetical protein M3313_02485 [Actinomycetota bacterium]|nr:hypothetical protein [Actinomycetota bacterium]